VRERYWREPTVLQNRDGLSKGSPSAVERELDDNMGEEIGFASKHIRFP
jgi:hypothetical protein